MSGYKLSDDEEQDIPPSQTQDLEPHDPDHPSDILHPPAPLMALPPPPPPTFDFHSFMHRSGGKLASLFLLIQELDELKLLQQVSCKGLLLCTTGGGARLVYFAYFAYFSFHLSHLYHGLHRREILKQSGSAFTRVKHRTNGQRKRGSMLHILHIVHIQHFVH